MIFITNRGYYPKGGGEVVVRVNPVKELGPINMTERGNITKIYGRAFVAGVLPFKVQDNFEKKRLCCQARGFNWIVFDVQLAKDMSTAAVRTIRKEIKDLYINIQSLQEKDKACGNGNGIMWVHLWCWTRLAFSSRICANVFLSSGRIIAESSTGCIFAGSSLGKKGKLSGCPECSQQMQRNNWFSVLVWPLEGTTSQREVCLDELSLLSP